MQIRRLRCTVFPEMVRFEGKCAATKISQLALGDATAVAKESSKLLAVIQTVKLKQEKPYGLRASR